MAPWVFYIFLTEERKFLLLNNILDTITNLASKMPGKVNWFHFSTGRTTHQLA